jgi:predicted dehydrogenase
MNSEDALKIKKEVENNKGFLAVTYNYTGYPMLRELRNIIQSGEIGEILHFQAQMPQEGFIRVNKNGEKPKPQEWRLQDETIPTIYLDLCSHLHEIIYYLINQKPTSVITDQATDGWFKNIIDNVNSLCRYGNVQGQVWFSKSALGYRNGLSIKIFGAKGSVSWVQTNPEELELAFSDGTKRILDRASNEIKIADKQRYTRFKAGHPTGFIEAFANVYYDIYKAIIEYQETGKWNSNEVFGVDLALEGLLFLEAMVKSSQTKKWEDIKEFAGKVL